MNIKETWRRIEKRVEELTGLPLTEATSKEVAWRKAIAASGASATRACMESMRTTDEDGLVQAATVAGVLICGETRNCRSLAVAPQPGDIPASARIDCPYQKGRPTTYLFEK